MKGVGNFGRPLKVEEDVAHQPLVGGRKTRRIALSCATKNITGRFVGLVTKHACDRRSDRRTDRITTPKTALA